MQTTGKRFDTVTPALPFHGRVSTRCQVIMLTRKNGMNVQCGVKAHQHGKRSA